MSYSDFHWITDRLAIGGMVSEPSDSFPFDTVLSMETHAPSTVQPLVCAGAVQYRWHSIMDGVSWESHDAIVRRFDDAAALIDEWQQQGRCTLVHCFAGVSRSVTAVVWYLVRYQGMTWEEGLERVRAARYQANPNIRFEIALRLAAGEDLTEEAIDRRIRAYCDRLNTEYGTDLQPEQVWADLADQGTDRHIPTRSA